MKNLWQTILFLFIFIGSDYNLFSQSIEEQMTKSHPNCQTMYINAMEVLPKLYREKSFDSLDIAVDLWERTCSGMPEVRITRVLLDMEEGKFTLSGDIDGATMDLLIDYAKYYASPDNMPSFHLHRGTVVSFFQFSSVWAKLLLENKKLDVNERFVCKVLTGEIRDPQNEIKSNPQTYTELNALLDKMFAAKRKRVRTDVTLTTGVWIPTGNLKTLGAHPSFGIQFGGRNMRHQLDLTLQFRYLHSANTYAIKREGHLDSTDYYFGGYIGLDYNYYFVSKPRYEIGLLAGMGYDGFDFSPDPYGYYYYYDYSSHVTIGSFNANAGLRFNYYFTPSFYLGLQGRYNLIDYYTYGGTDLSGNAFSIDLIFGFNGLK